MRGRYGSGGWDGSSINLLGSSLPAVNLTNTRLNEVNFENCTFDGPADFDDEIFLGRVSFRGAMFSKHASFTGATFLDDCDFAETLFLEGANFHGAIFHNRCSFREATFAVVRKPLLYCSTRFSRATFIDSTDFTDTSILVSLRSGQYLRRLMFEEVVFLGNEVAVNENSFIIEWQNGSDQSVAEDPGKDLHAERDLILKILRPHFSWRNPSLLLSGVYRYFAILPRIARANAIEHSSRV